mmetsp:Transcript_78311/g.143367  ORF Transcript_78311/g.143367 Transcript_78311/m.143367 type:complete len:329 (-) Transcript_78311:60-1046(-)
MATKVRIIAGTWTVIGGIAGLKYYRNVRDFETQTPCLGKALRELGNSDAARAVLGPGELQVSRWSRKRRLDEASGLARASFQVYGSSGSADVFMGTRRSQQAQAAWEDDLDDEPLARAGFMYYFTRPWVLKRAVVDGTKSLVGLEKASKASAGAEAEQMEQAWELQTLFFLPGGDVHKPIVLMGNACGIPDYESLCVRRDADTKGEKSRRRLYGFIGMATAVAAVAGGLRLVRSVHVSQSYGYARRCVLTHPAVVSVLGPSASVSTSSGTFGARYLNARMRLVGEAGAVADVDFAAMRDGEARRTPWRVALARMTTAGRTTNLDKSHF